MFQVADDHITRAKTRQKFYSIPSIRNMIAVRQLSFIGKAVRSNTPGLPTKLMITACCNNKRHKKGGRPQLHNKDTLVSNLQLLFDKVNYVMIDDQGSLKDWIKYAQDPAIWRELICCLLDSTKELPKQPNWDTRRRSTRNQTRNSQPESSTRDEPNRRPPPRNQRRDRPSRPWRRNQVGVNRYDSFKILGLEIGASEIEVTVAYRALARIYHPDRIPNDKTDMNREEATAHFQLLNNAYRHLKNIL